MSAVEEELEEGEISDSDSMGEEQKPQQTGKPAAPQYSIFDNQPRARSKTKNFPQSPQSGSDSSDDDEEDGAYSDDDNRKKQKLHGIKTDPIQSKFVNPNFVNNGGKMPPAPKQSNRAIWGSILQEQILSAEIGSFTMEKKMPSDRNVESYDYSRAKDDDRPHPVEDEMKNVEGDLFGEVIDLEKAALKQKRNLKRKHVNERLGKRKSVRERLDVPKVTESSSVEDVTYFISHKLQETKVHLIRRVVLGVGRAKALELLKQTEEVEASGGMLIMNGSRRRTPGGVYLTLLKTDVEVTKEQQDEIFEEENKWSLEMRRRKRARARSRRKEQSKQRTSTTEDKGDKPSSMEVMEDNNSRSSVEGQTGSPKNHADHLSDTQESVGAKEHDSADSDSEEGKVYVEKDFGDQLAYELQRQAAAKAVKEPSADGDADGVTLDDVLDLGIDECDID